ncbi:MAG TPA: RNA polymerase sigma factor [Gammaproteobacteria bacterium]|nr:RNA polymerase sigma factor [Gammaproteobacteria bacterium]
MDSRADEKRLIGRVLEGDAAAQRELYDALVDRVFALAFRITGQEAAARDCTQLVFIRLFDKLGSFRGDSALATWVHAVAVSVILQWRRSTRQVRLREVELDSAAEASEPGSSYDDAVNDTIRRAIDGLAEKQRVIVVMHDLEGYTHEEIGAALGIAAGASKVRLMRARKKLKDALADFAGDLAYDH